MKHMGGSMELSVPMEIPTKEWQKFLTNHSQPTFSDLVAPLTDNLWGHFCKLEKTLARYTPQKLTWNPKTGLIAKEFPFGGGMFRFQLLVFQGVKAKVCLISDFDPSKATLNM